MAYKSLFIETADKEIEEGGIHFIYHNGADVKPELTEYESNAMGQGTSIASAIKDAVTKLAKAHGWKKSNVDYLTTKVTEMAEKAGYDVKAAISPEQQFLPGIPKKFSKGLHFVEIALDDDFVGEVVEAIIKFINDGEENAERYANDSADDYIHFSLDRDNFSFIPSEIEEKMEAAGLTEKEFIEKIDEDDLKAEYNNSNGDVHTNDVVLASYEVGEYEDQLDAGNHTITTPFGEIDFVDAIASLTPEQFKEVQKKSYGYIRDSEYRNAQDKTRKYRSVTVTYNLGGSVEVYLPAEKALEMLGEKPTPANKIGKVKQLRKLAQESYKSIFSETTANIETQKDLDEFFQKNGRNIGGSLYLGDTLITSLPENLKVGRDLYLGNTKITSLPENLQVGGDLYLGNTKITSLPENLKVGRDLYLYRTLITSLPENLQVGGNLNLSETKITSLPENLQVGGEIFGFTPPEKSKPSKVRELRKLAQESYKPYRRLFT